MKTKIMALALCVILAFFVFTGCGLKMPDNSDVSPSDNTAGSPSGSDRADTTTVSGIVRFVDSETITLELVGPGGGQSDADAETVSVGSAVYVLTGSTKVLNPGAETAIILGNQGFVSGSTDDVKAGDFLVAFLQGDMVIAVVDAGNAAVTNTETEGVQPGVEPTDNGNEPSTDITDTSEPAVYTVITDGLKVRSGPGTDYAALGVLDTGSRVTGVIADGWIKYTYDGKTAYSSAEYLEASTAPAGVPDSGESKTYKTADNVLARSGPGTTYSSLGTLQKGAEVKGTVLGGWLKFTYNDKTAYCSAAYLTAG